jgi:inorganic triphosphatase YgiF
VRDYREIETKFDVPPGFSLPDIAQLQDGGATTSVEVRLVSTYYDTPDRALMRLRRTLRLRSGSDDPHENGWQLKVPADDGTGDRIELHADGDESGVPDELARLALGATHGRGVRPVARTTVQRIRSRLHDAAGRTLLELADDDVHAVSMGGAAREAGSSAVARRWREVEVELVDGERDLLAQAARLLGESGARPSESSSKLQRALGAPEQPAAPFAARKGRPTHGSVVLSYLHAQFTAIEDQDLAVRRRGEDAVHRQRVATRRARSTLRVFADLFDRDAAAQLDEELRWFAGVLGEVRDREVLRKRLAEAVAALPEELVIGPVAADIDAALEAEQREHEERLDEAMSSDRYLALLVLLDQWRAVPPVDRRLAMEGVDRALRDAGRARRKLDKRLTRAAELHAPAAGESGHAEVDEALHAARKQAKRARYAYEAVEALEELETAPPAKNRRKNGKKTSKEVVKPPVKSAVKSARRARRKMEALQELLGEHQDGVVTAQVLRRLGGGFTYGVLFEKEQERARRSAADLLS